MRRLSNCHEGCPHLLKCAGVAIGPCSTYHRDLRTETTEGKYFEKSVCLMEINFVESICLLFGVAVHSRGKSKRRWKYAVHGRRETVSQDHSEF